MKSSCVLCFNSGSSPFSHPLSSLLARPRSRRRRLVFNGHGSTADSARYSNFIFTYMLRFVYFSTSAISLLHAHINHLDEYIVRAYPPSVGSAILYSNGRYDYETNASIPAKKLPVLKSTAYKSCLRNAHTDRYNHRTYT